MQPSGVKKKLYKIQGSSSSRVQRLKFQRVLNMQKIVMKTYRSHEFQCGGIGTYVTYHIFIPGLCFIVIGFIKNKNKNTSYIIYNETILAF